MPYFRNEGFKENNEKQMTLIRASTDYKNMMDGLSALQLTYE